MESSEGALRRLEEEEECEGQQPRRPRFQDLGADNLGHISSFLSNRDFVCGCMEF